MFGPVACVGAGRLGPALLRRWHDAGIPVLGILGRDDEKTDAALRFCTVGRRLSSYGELSAAEIVLLGVGDQDLAGLAVDAASAGAVKPGSLWLHCSGVHGLEVLAPLAEKSARLAAMHPLCPVPDREIGYRSLAGKAALIESAAADRACLQELAESCGLLPVHLDRPIDRALYHAACSLAANGLTSLVDLSTGMFRSISGLEPEQIEPMLSGLMAGSLQACSEVGSSAALSGPVARGDHRVLAEHLAALEIGTGSEVYRSLMLHALKMALVAGQVNQSQASAIEETLRGHGEAAADG